MLKRIFHLSACLAMILALNPAQAEIRYGDFPQGKCPTDKSKEFCINYCKPQIEACKKASNNSNSAYACCYECMWPSVDLRQQGVPATWIRQCAGN